MTTTPIRISAPGSHPTRRGLVLHGILGSGKNWRSFARSLTTQAPDWEWFLADLRAHGDSPKRPSPHTVASCAEDLLELGPMDMVIGHSFGGKVALSYAELTTAPLKAVWVLDTNPGAAGDDLERLGTQDIYHVIQALERIPLPIPTRDNLVTSLTAGGFSRTLALWMTTNLRPTSGGFTWRFDLSVVSQLLADYLGIDHFPTLEKTTHPCHVVRAERTQWPSQDVDRLTAWDVNGKIRYHVLPESGHWVHVDAPKALAELILSSTQG